MLHSTRIYINFIDLTSYCTGGPRSPRIRVQPSLRGSLANFGDREVYATIRHAVTLIATLTACSHETALRVCSAVISPRVLRTRVLKYLSTHGTVFISKCTPYGVCR